MDDKEQPAAVPRLQAGTDSTPGAPAGQTEPEKPKQWTAHVDNHGVLTGFDKTGEGPGIPVPADCDLEPFKYRWDGEHFVPDMQAFKGKAIVAPDAMSAIALALIAIRDGKPLPDYTLAWLAAWEKSFDAKGLK